MNARYLGYNNQMGYFKLYFPQSLREVPLGMEMPGILAVPHSNLCFLQDPRDAPVYLK